MVMRMIAHKSTSRRNAFRPLLERARPCALARMILPLAMACLSTTGAQLPPGIAADRLVVRAEFHAREGEFDAAMNSLQEALALRREHGLETPPVVWFRRATVQFMAGAHTQALESATRYLMALGRDGEHYSAALAIVDASERALQAVENERRAYSALRERLSTERSGLERAFADPLRSGGQGPEMVSIPGGEFRMGCLSEDAQCQGNELPIRRVAIEPFALSRHEVTFAEWDACVAGGGCAGYLPPDASWGRADRPAIHVSWEDAQSYVAWLSSQTGAAYRLPSEAEWEYAARAGTPTAYSWGEEIGSGHANCNGCGSAWDDERTASAASFAANTFGLYDMHGNVFEWVQDCWNESHAGAPSDSTPRSGGDCNYRVLRGGAWDARPESLRAAYRARSTAGARFDLIGFRVARAPAP